MYCLLSCVGVFCEDCLKPGCCHCSSKSLPGSSGEDLDLVADRLASRLSDTVTLIRDILLHVRI